MLSRSQIKKIKKHKNEKLGHISLFSRLLNGGTSVTVGRPTVTRSISTVEFQRPVLYLRLIEMNDITVCLV